MAIATTLTFRPPSIAGVVKTLTAMLPQYSEREALMISPAGKVEKTVFYFPGCGSERLYSEISMAAIYLLAKNNIRVVLPPPFLCCGFPAKVNRLAKILFGFLIPAGAMHHRSQAVQGL